MQIQTGAGVVINVTATGLDQVRASIRRGLDITNALSKVVAKYTRKVQALAVRNVSGNPVTWQGGTFVVNRYTGKLARSIQITELSPLSGTVQASANYASFVHNGRAAVDLKQTSLAGKIVPLKTKDGLIFRRVGKTGWIIPARKPKPFMAAAAASVEADFTAAIQAAMEAQISGTT